MTIINDVVNIPTLFACQVYRSTHEHLEQYEGTSNWQFARCSLNGLELARSDYGSEQGKTFLKACAGGKIPFLKKLTLSFI